MPEPILIVEDDNTIRVTVGNFLARQGFDVEVAEDGAQALAMLKERSFSLILLDLRLPDMNGLDILATIRESDDRPLVVIMTAYPEVRTAVAALKAGAYDYINNVHIVVDADVRDNGITTSARGLASGGGVFANGTLYLGVENNGTSRTR